MKNTKLIIIILLILISQTFLFCGKTETDIKWEEDIIGYWIPIGNDNLPVDNMPTYKFDLNSRGASHYAPTNDVDSFGWEIKRAQLKVYYDEAPSYYIAYDKYNSRSLFKITDMNDTSVSVIQFYSAGYQKEYYMKKSILIEEEEEF
ncbi:MAG: hypothetical protein PHW83_00955 [Bacteroidales bacterium]|nr:hypothetical protein [Bacteroidales bacterium]